jgi:hypothetical protein
LPTRRPVPLDFFQCAIVDEIRRLLAGEIGGLTRIAEDFYFAARQANIANRRKHHITQEGFAK